VTAINERRPLKSPQEVVALRKELADLKAENGKLADDVAAIRKQLESLATPAKQAAQPPE
jgi:uncharacterized membrane protein